VLGDGSEDVEDAAAHRELAPARDHVDAGIGQVDKLGGQFGEVVAAAAGDELERFEAREVVGERLEGGAHARDDDEVADGLVGLHGLLPALEMPEGADALADGLGARAQPLVRERLPRGELDDLGLGGEARERAAQRLGITTGGHDREERLRTRAGIQKSGEEGGAEAVDEGEVCAAGGVGEGVFERAGARERTSQALEDHRKSLRAAPDGTLRVPLAAGGPSAEGGREALAVRRVEGSPAELLARPGVGHAQVDPRDHLAGVGSGEAQHPPGDE
jgi:hypothetical protein